jgi:hypothetical protein
MENDCKDKECKITISKELYEQLHKDIFFILCPTAMQQLKPNSWAYATSRKRIGEILVVVKQFIAERLVEYVGEKKK